MNRQEKIDTLIEAQKLLAEAEDLIRQTKDRYLEVYVADHIDSNQLMLGTGLYQEVEQRINELKSDEEEIKDI